MIDFKPDQESISRADSLSEHLMQDLRNMVDSGPLREMSWKSFSAHRYAKQAEYVPIEDVISNVRQMAYELAMARRWDSQILCVKHSDGELAPISLADLFGIQLGGTYGAESWIDFWEEFGRFPFRPHHYWKEILRRTNKEGENVVLTDVQEAEDGIHRSLSSFLSYRFAGIKKFAEWIHGNDVTHSTGAGSSSQPPRPPAVGTGGGLQVQVSCLTPGLRIHISPAYFINWIFFGSPTSPVTSYVFPGRYIFAGDGPMLPKRTRDGGVFCIPPTYHPSLSRF